jgi:hypothetical protein
MGRSLSLPRLPAAVALVILPWAVARGEGRTYAQETAKEQSKSTPREAIERRPYLISVHLSCDPSARIDEGRRADLLRDWQILLRRFVGAPWVVSIAQASSPLANVDLDALEPAAFSSFSTFDKVWVVRLAHSEPDGGLGLSGREFDTATARIGPLQRRSVLWPGDVPRALLLFAHDLFSPTAEISGQEGGLALLKVQGAALAPASPLGAVVAPGTVFQPLRVVSRNGKVQVSKIRYTYLQVETVDGPVARCAIVSGLHDPLTARVTRPSSLAALGLKPGNNPLQLRFVTRPNQAPAAGYTVTVRRVPDGQSRSVGTTDRAGRIILRPGFADGLVILRVLAGSVEPMVELPIMPGDIPDERPIAFDPKPQTIALEARLDSLRDEVVDLVALRARLEARMKARLDGEDWAGLAEALKEFSQLPPRDQFAQRLTTLKDEAAREQEEQKKAVLTKTAQAQISDLQSMIDRYLDDEIFKSYADASERAQTDAGAKSKTKSKTDVVTARIPKAVPKASSPAKPKVEDKRPAAAPAQPKTPPRPQPSPPTQPF